MILLDTNVLSALMQQRPDPQVIRWLDSQPRTSIWTTSVAIFEVRFGLQTMVSGKRKTSLAGTFEHLLANVLHQRIAQFDSAAAQHAADLAADRQKRGRPGELRDTMIAGIVLATRATLATRNTRHFAEIASSIVDPWTY